MTTTSIPMPAPESPLGALEPLAALDEARRRRVLGTVVVAGIVFVTLTELVFIGLAGRVMLSSGISAVIDAGLIAAWLILRRRHFDAAVLVTLATLAFAFPATMLQAGGLHAPVIIAMPLIPVLVASFAGARRATALSALLVLGTVAVWIATRLGLVPPSPLREAAGDTMNAVFASFCIGLGMFAARTTEHERNRFEASLHARSRADYERSIHDPLTGLHNRRYLMHRLDEELAFALRHGTALGVIILDVDHFKQINDQYGHGGGDQLLAAFGQVLHGSMRREDVVARYGGEEFALVLRGLTLASVALAAERVRRNIEDHAFYVAGHRVPVTVSVGCASVACCGEPTAVQLLAVADARLYRAKRSGRNRVAFTD